MRTARVYESTNLLLLRLRISELTSHSVMQRKFRGRKKKTQQTKPKPTLHVFSAYKVVARGAKRNNFEPNSWFDGCANYRPGLFPLR